MLARLSERGYLPGRLEAAFASADRARFVPAAYRALAHLDLPLPLVAGRADVSFSPRAVALFLRALDPAPGDRVLLAAPDGGHLAAAAAELVGPRGAVVLATGSPASAATAGRRLSAAGYATPRVRATSAPPFEAGPFDRILLAEEAAFVPTGARAALSELGQLLTRHPVGDRVEVVRTIRSGDQYAELRLGELDAARRPLGAGVEEPWPIRRLLSLEEAQRRVWTGGTGTPEEAEFARAVGETWKPPRGKRAPASTGPAKRAAASLGVAKRLFHAGYVYLMAGDLENAEDAFRASFAVTETAEALTFLGWTFSFMGRFEDAIQECERAIGVDPGFGNAYNDIGAYLLEMGRAEESVAWLERAMHAPRYSARVYPYANLARARLMMADQQGAKAALEAALRVDPDYAPARDLLNKLEGREPTEEAEDGDRDDADEESGAGAAN